MSTKKTKNILDERVEEVEELENLLDEDALDLIEKKIKEEEDEDESKDSDDEMSEEEDDDDEDEDEVKENFESDLSALVDSEATLSEGFRAKAAVIFEAAMKSKLSEAVNRLENDYQVKLDEELEANKADLKDKVDGYLNYVIESWMVDNALAIETGIRTEIAESFIDKLHGVFSEHYVEVPDSKVDLVDELANKVDALEESVNAEVSKNIELVNKNKSLSREKIIRESSIGLSESESEKLKSLSEDINFDDSKSFTDKVETLKESYFKKNNAGADIEEIQEDAGQATSVNSSMASYLAALKQSN